MFADVNPHDELAVVALGNAMTGAAAYRKALGAAEGAAGRE